MLHCEILRDESRHVIANYPETSFLCIWGLLRISFEALMAEKGVLYYIAPTTRAHGALLKLVLLDQKSSQDHPKRP